VDTLKKIPNTLLENFPSVAVVIAVVSTFLSPGDDFAKTLLQNMLVWCVGGQGIWGATGHILMGDQVAKGIGWPTGSPFQRELGFVTLGLGIAGLMCVSQGQGFWLATIIIYSTFLLGAGFGHIYEVFKHHNKAKYNAGPILYTDLIVPSALLGLYWYVFIR
jgi:hypothetical protein